MSLGGTHIRAVRVSSTTAFLLSPFSFLSKTLGKPSALINLDNHAPLMRGLINRIGQHAQGSESARFFRPSLRPTRARSLPLAGTFQITMSTPLDLGPGACI